MAQHPWRSLRTIVPLFLLLMILMRLVWMQLRVYPLIFDARFSEASRLALLGGCKEGDEVAAQKSSETLMHRAEKNTKNKDKFSTVFGKEEIERPASSPDEKSHGISLKHLNLRPLIPLGLDILARFLCRSDFSHERSFLRANQVFLVLTVFFATLMTRFLTRSWSVSLIVAGMLMSRGHLLTNLGRLSSDWILTFCATLWMTSLAHYLRSGARLSLLAAFLSLGFGSFFDGALAALGLALPIVLALGFLSRKKLRTPVLRKLRSDNRRLRAFKETTSEQGTRLLEKSLAQISEAVRWLLGIEFSRTEPGTTKLIFERGNLFKPLEAPFILWVYHRNRWLNLIVASILVFVIMIYISFFGFETGRALQGGFRELSISMGLMLKIGREFYHAWTLSMIDRFDLHLKVSLLLIVLCALQSPSAGLSGFFEASWITLIGGVLLVFSSLFLDAFDRSYLRTLSESYPFSFRMEALAPRVFVMWLEPLILSMGIGSIYNLIKVFDNRFIEKQ